MGEIGGWVGFDFLIFFYSNAISKLLASSVLSLFSVLYLYDPKLHILVNRL